MSAPRISPAAQAERNLVRLVAIAQDLADPRLEDLAERQAGLATDLQRQEIRDRNQAARLANLAGAIAEIAADLEADHKPRKHLVELLAYWSRIAAEIGEEAGR